jgi:hypothetical protein
MSELEKLEDLYGMGFICEEEFIRRKEELGITSDPSSDPFSVPQPVSDPVCYDILVSPSLTM